jgi:DNA repair exonuclease SbcCD nuclease subunit
MKWLFVGDVHATVQELGDCEKLVDLILEKTDLDTEVVFLGDQYHTHATLRIEVVDFWNRALKRIKEASQKVILVVGNHDMPNDSSQKVHSLLANNTDGMFVVDGPFKRFGIGFLPYYHDREKFVKDANALDTNTIVCHQTFDGAKYENGFYAKDGVDPSLLNATHIISGHIHAPSQFDKVTYVGAPRWRTASDANTDRFLHLYEPNISGTLRLVEKIPTGNHCRKILQATVYEDGTYEGRTDALEGDILQIDIVGSKEFCDTKKAELTASNHRIRTFPKSEKSIKVRESDGIDKAFSKYVSSFCKSRSIDESVMQGELGKVLRSNV